MSKIATETEARTIGGSGSAETGRMCTKARAIALGCNVASSYADNQLVQYEHLSKFIKPTIIRKVKFIVISGGSPLKCNIDGFGYLNNPPLNTNYQIDVDSSVTACELSNITCGSVTAWQCDSSSVGIQNQLWMPGNFVTSIYVSDTLR